MAQSFNSLNGAINMKLLKDICPHRRSFNSLNGAINITS